MSVYDMFLLMELGGASFMVHIFSSQLLRALVRWRSPLAMDLFAVPNAPIAPDWGFRLLRAKYFLPWRPAPDALKQEPILTRLVFVLASFSGLAMPVLMLLFFASGFYIAGAP